MPEKRWGCYGRMQASGMGEPEIVKLTGNKLVLGHGNNTAPPDKKEITPTLWLLVFLHTLEKTLIWKGRKIQYDVSKV